MGNRKSTTDHAVWKKTHFLLQIYQQFDIGHVYVIHFFLVAVGIGSEGLGIHDAFVEDHSVSLCFFNSLQGLGVYIAFDLVRIVDSDFPRVFFGFG